MDSRERLRILKSIENISYEAMGDKTGIKKKRLENVMYGATMSADEMGLICKAYPEYAYWLATGKEEPSVGQISPMTAKAAELLKQSQADG